MMSRQYHVSFQPNISFGTVWILYTVFKVGGDTHAPTDSTLGLQDFEGSAHIVRKVKSPHEKVEIWVVSLYLSTPESREACGNPHCSQWLHMLLWDSAYRSGMYAQRLKWL
eukprot:6466483-Amphidinium_carterae.1